MLKKLLSIEICSYLYYYIQSLIKLFYFPGIVTTISRLTKLCVLRLTKDNFYFIVLDESALPLRTSVWCVLQQSHFFNEYRLVGAPEDENEIFLELSPGKSLTLLKIN